MIITDNGGVITTTGSQIIAPITQQTTQIGITNVAFIDISPTSFSGTESAISITIVNQSAISSSDKKNSEITSEIVDIKVIGDANVNDLTICLASTGSKKDSCLGYLDESQDPPQWKCEDKCLKDNNDNNSTDNNSNYLCGKTTHLTNFAILFEGIAKGGGCSYEGDFILGSAENDLILSASVAAFVVLCALILLILYCFTPLRKYIVGEEGYRMANLRTGRSTPENATEINL